MVYKQQDKLPTFGYHKEIIFHSIQLYFYHLSTVKSKLSLTYKSNEYNNKS